MNFMNPLANARREISVDEYVGRRLASARMSRGLSRTELGEQIGLSEQFVADFEAGTRRIGATFLMRLCAQLETTPSYFFWGRSSVETGDNLDLQIAELTRTFAGLPSAHKQLAVRFIREIDGLAQDTAE